MSSRFKRIGLTGATGVLGQTLRSQWQGVEWIPYPGRIQDLESVSKWLETGGSLDAVIHLAAVVPTAQVEANPGLAVQTNVVGTCNLLESIRRQVSQEMPAPWIFLC